MTATTTTMTAWSQSRYGGPDVLARGRAPRPAPAAGEVTVAIAASALNSADIRILRGDPLLVRLAFGLRRPRTAVPGRDVAGTVVEVGAGVDAWRPGDRIVGELSGGGLGEAVAAPADRLVAVPDDLDLAVAATLPLAGGTAWQALDLAGVGAGSRVLVVGAGGGVGTFAVRLAVLRGADVHALCGARAVPVVAALGAERVEDYRTVDLVARAAERRGGGPAGSSARSSSRSARAGSSAPSPRLPGPRSPRGCSTSRHPASSSRTSSAPGRWRRRGTRSRTSTTGTPSARSW